MTNMGGSRGRGLFSPPFFTILWQKDFVFGLDVKHTWQRLDRSPIINHSPLRIDAQRFSPIVYIDPFALHNTTLFFWLNFHKRGIDLR